MPFWVILLVVAGFVAVSSNPPLVLFGLFVIYGLSGWVVMVWRWRRARYLLQQRQDAAQQASDGNPPAASRPGQAESSDKPFDR